MTREQFVWHVEGCQGALRRFLTALCCGDAALADDLAQESLIKAWLSADSFRADSTFSTWIHRIAYNTFINYRRGAVPKAPLTEASVVASESASDDAFRYQPLYEALALLSVKERMSILLHYLEGYTIREIAEIEEVSEAAVKQHLSRGREHLRTLLK